MQVPCGHCAECQTNLSNQWYYRTWYEWQDLGLLLMVMLFDTLLCSKAFTNAFKYLGLVLTRPMIFRVLSLFIFAGFSSFFDKGLILCWLFKKCL